MDIDRTIEAFRWRMGLIAHEDQTARQDWEFLEDGVLADAERRKAVTNKMAEPLVDILSWGLFERPGESMTTSWGYLRDYLKGHPALLKAMMDKFASFVKDDINAEPPIPMSKEQEPQMSEFQSGDVPENAETKTPDALMPEDETTILIERPTTASKVAAEPPPATGSFEAREPEAQGPGTGSHEQDSSIEQSREQSAEAKIESSPDADSEPTPQPDLEPIVEKPAEAPEQTDTTTASVATPWKYKPVPEGPDNHDESYQLAGESPEGLKIIGARARGKKHKNDGTNCDDWFEFCHSGPWTIIAVSDGAGSYVFSRIGAKESCRTAMTVLSEALADHNLKTRERWSNETFKRNKQTGEFAEEDLEYVQSSLHDAMRKAYARVQAKADELAKSPAHEAVLKRKPKLQDFSGTLLLAVHTTVVHEGAERSFVLTCHIGDGMLAAISLNGGLQLLGEPDSGAYAGQTEFLTSAKKVEKANLIAKTFPFFGPMQALMVMTDGVADDYFPNDPGMLELYGDLAINGILHLRGKDGQQLIDSNLARTALKNTQGVANARLASPVDAITPNGTRPVFIRSIKTYAEKLGLPLDEVIKSTPLLIAGTISDPGEEMCSEKESEEMLLVWLDSYNVRGSFDDRTLVVLYREVPE